jgi:DNA-binding LytR/AlgR family response regulator
MSGNDKLRALIVDDEADAISVLSELLKDSGRVSEVIPLMESNKVECTLQKSQPDVLFLDIKMPGLDGLTILENIREYDQNLPVIYITAFDKYITEAIKLHVFSYLLKPVDREELNILLDRLLDTKGNKAQLIITQKIKLPVKDGYIYLHIDEIFSLEADGNYTRIVTTNQDVYLSSYNMGRLAKRIPGQRLFRINRKNFLNCRYLVRINKKELKCTARVNNQDYSFDISKSFLSQFNKEVV